MDNFIRCISSSSNGLGNYYKRCIKLFPEEFRPELGEIYAKELQDKRRNKKGGTIHTVKSSEFS